MYCKKCGTEQKDGQKFCPKCGEPFIEVSEKPHIDEYKKSTQSIVDEFRKIDWNEKKEQATSFLKEFMSNPANLSLVTKVVVCLFALWFLLKVGFSASIIWYIVIAIILYIAFMGIPKIKSESIKAQYITTASCLVFILLVGWGSDNTSSLFGISSKNAGPREICIVLQSEVKEDKGRIVSVNVNGNYGMIHAVAGYFTNVITVPHGKMWIFNKQEIDYYGEKGFHPDICYYNLGDTNAIPKIYNCHTQARSIPVFRGNDKLRIRVRHTYIGNGWSPTSMEAKVYFIE